MINKDFSESDFVYLPLQDCDSTVVSDFFKTLNNRTLGNKVTDAINQRRQGHFNKAMLNITEANRDQVIAIREIQSILDGLNGKDKTEVILNKFRQQYPFQMGLVNGKEVLNLLEQIKSILNDEFPNMINELHQNEERLSSLHQELNFFEERLQGKISDQELNSLKINISLLNENICFTKSYIIEFLDNFLIKEYSTAEPNQLIRIIKNLYVILTSSIETLNAKQVEM